MVNYSIKIKEIRVIYVDSTMPDYVKFIDGILFAEQNGIILSQPISACVPTVTVENYTPFADLTEPQVITMLETSIDPDYYALIKSELENSLAQITTNQFPYVKALPWV